MDLPLLSRHTCSYFHLNESHIVKLPLFNVLLSELVHQLKAGKSQTLQKSPCLYILDKQQITTMSLVYYSGVFVRKSMMFGFTFPIPIVKTLGIYCIGILEHGPSNGCMKGNTYVHRYSVLTQECIPVGCVPSAAVAVSPEPSPHHHTCPPATHAPPGQNDRRL